MMHSALFLCMLLSFSLFTFFPIRKLDVVTSIVDIPARATALTTKEQKSHRNNETEQAQGTIAFLILGLNSASCQFILSIKVYLSTCALFRNYRCLNTEKKRFFRNCSHLALEAFYLYNESFDHYNDWSLSTHVRS